MPQGTGVERRVLLVEDDEDIRDLLSRLIHSYGCTTVLAASWGEVDAALADGPVALALLDIMLPGIDGRELAAGFREEKRPFPVYFVTGMHSLVREADRRNVDGVLHKPFTVAELRDLLDRTVGHSDAPEATTDQSAEDQRHSLELMTAIAAQQEALRRQETELKELLATATQPGADAETRAALDRLTDRHKASLENLSGLLDAVRDRLQ